MSRQQLRVLLIVDDEDDFIIIRDLLADVKNQKYRLDWIATFEPALKEIEQNHHDVYLIDYYLGEQNGLELIDTAVKNGCKSPLILLTNQRDHQIDVHAMKAGAADYLVKDQIDAPLLARSIRYATEPHHAKKVLRESDAHFRQVLASVSAHIYETQIDTNGKPTNLYISPTVETLGFSEI